MLKRLLAATAGLLPRPLTPPLASWPRLLVLPVLKRLSASAEANREVDPRGRPGLEPSAVSIMLGCFSLERARGTKSLAHQSSLAAGPPKPALSCPAGTLGDLAPPVYMPERLRIGEAKSIPTPARSPRASRPSNFMAKRGSVWELGGQSPEANSIPAPACSPRASRPSNFIAKRGSV